MEKVTSRAELKIVQLEPWLEPPLLGLITTVYPYACAGAKKHFCKIYVTHEAFAKSKISGQPTQLWPLQKMNLVLQFISMIQIKWGRSKSNTYARAICSYEGVQRLFAEAKYRPFQIMNIMAILVVEFSRKGYKSRKIFG